MTEVNAKNACVTPVFMIMAWIAATFLVFAKIVHMKRVKTVNQKAITILWQIVSIIFRISNQCLEKEEHEKEEHKYEKANY